jgi:Fe-S-cluster containining protein
MSKFEDLVKKIQEDKTLNLNDLKKLDYDQVELLLEEIKTWCIYANGDTKKLKKYLKDSKE